MFASTSTAAVGRTVLVQQRPIASRSRRLTGRGCQSPVTCSRPFNREKMKLQPELNGRRLRRPFSRRRVGQRLPWQPRVAQACLHRRRLRLAQPHPARWSAGHQPLRPANRRQPTRPPARVRRATLGRIFPEPTCLDRTPVDQASAHRGNSASRPRRLRPDGLFPSRGKNHGSWWRRRPHLPLQLNRLRARSLPSHRLRARKFVRPPVRRLWPGLRCRLLLPHRSWLLPHRPLLSHRRLQ